MTIANGVFRQTSMMNQPPQVLLHMIAQFQADKMLGSNRSIVEIISNVLDTNVDMKARFSRPADDQDWLFNPAYDHPHDEDSCINCDKGQLIH